MEQDLSKLGSRARRAGGQFWQGLGTGRKVSIIAIGTVAVALIALFLLWASNPSYSVAYANLSEEQAGQVVAKLKEMKVPYQIRDETTILVPTDQVADARLQLASAGVPGDSGVGYELFDQTNFGLTDFAEKINYQRALEGELSRTINHLDAVDQSRVHIVIPQPSLYSDTQDQATASVMLMLKPGRQLNESQLRGVTQLVSGSVEGLKPEQVTIVDGKGNILSTPASDGGDSAASSTRVEAERAYEAQLANDIQGMLGRIVGPNHTTVQVSAAFNWDQVQSTSETYSPNGLPAQVLSRHDVVEGGSGSGAAASGIPGVDSNIPTYQQLAQSTPTVPAASATPGAQATGTPTARATTVAVPTAVGSSATSLDGAVQRESTVNYELSKQTQQVVQAPGGIKRLSVAVAVDSGAVSDAQVESLRQAVAAAAGLDTSRGDALTMVSLPFAKADTVDQQQAQAAAQQDLILSGARAGAMVVGPLVVLLVIWLLVRRPKRRAAAVIAASQPLRLPTNLPAVAALKAEARPNILAAMDEEQLRRSDLRKEVYDLAQTDPATLARLIQTWLEESEN